MSPPNLDSIAHLHAISTCLSDASAMARAALTCAEAGSEHRALNIILDLDILLHEANTLHGALRLISRPPRGSTGYGTVD